MGNAYRQFCPVAKAMELLDERWTLLVVRELVIGSQRFNDLRRGVPRMSPALLSKRLRQLTSAGIVERVSDDSGVRYELTDAGRELRPVVEALGKWGTRWSGELGDSDLDPKLLLWDMHRNVNQDRLPPGRTTVSFRFPDVAPALRQWWLVLAPDDVDVCDVDPGFDVAVTVRAGLRTLTRIWRGDLAWADARRSGELELVGRRELCVSLPGWFALSPFASVPRPLTAAR
jgi:DNA-binding HxlR family transcriptional regulator